MFDSMKKRVFKISLFKLDNRGSENKADFEGYIWKEKDSNDNTFEGYLEATYPSDIKDTVCHHKREMKGIYLEDKKQLAFMLFHYFSPDWFFPTVFLFKDIEKPGIYSNGLDVSRLKIAIEEILDERQKSSHCLSLYLHFNNLDRPWNLQHQIKAYSEEINSLADYLRLCPSDEELFEKIIHYTPTKLF